MSKSKKMSKAEIAVRFAELSDLADKRNAEIKKSGKMLRFIPMKHIRKDRLQEFGLYDYLTKRYTLSSIHSVDAPKILKEMQKMLEANNE